MRGRVAHRGGEVGDDVGDLHEIPDLLAVAVDFDAETLGHAAAENRDHAAIGRARVLAGTIDVEEAQAEARHAVDVPAGGGVQFGGKFVGAVCR